MQNKKMSLIETITSTAIGFFISLVLVNIVLPFYGFDVKLGQSVAITVIFTVASILRGYGVRRLFNYIHLNLNNKQNIPLCSSCKDEGEYEVSAGTHSFFVECHCKKLKG